MAALIGLGGATRSERGGLRKGQQKEEEEVYEKKDRARAGLW